MRARNLLLVATIAPLGTVAAFQVNSNNVQRIQFKSISPLQRPKCVSRLVSRDRQCCYPIQINRSKYSRLQMMREALHASSTLLVSATIGTQTERFGFLGGNFGTITTLIVAAFFSNIGLSPSSHALFDLCWTRLLPWSLAMTLLSSPAPLKESKFDDTIEYSPKQATSDISSLLVRETSLAMSIPFIIGSIGSLMGCFLSFFVVVTARLHPIGESPTIIGHWLMSIWNSVGMDPEIAAVAAGCLCSSYIGGTFNFFCTAAILTKQYNLNIGMKSLITSMAAVDLIVMAIYFGIMSAAMSWKKLRICFPGRSYSMIGELGISREYKISIADRSDKEITPCNKRLASSILFASLLVWPIVEIAIKVEEQTSKVIPGLSCGVIVILTATVKKILNLLVKRFNFISWISRDLNSATALMSTICFHLLFASLGISANFRKAICHGPSTLVFALLALAIHVIVILFGSLGITKALLSTGLSTKIYTIFQKNERKIYPFELEEVMVASNACIGGPSTAAVFAANTRLSGDTLLTERRQALIVAATLWGVVGYAVATSIGVSVTNILQKLISKFYIIG